MLYVYVYTNKEWTYTTKNPNSRGQTTLDIVGH